MKNIDLVGITCFAIVLGVLMFVGTTLGATYGIKGLGLLSLIGGGYYIWASIDKVEHDQKGALLFLGYPYANVGPGPVLAPLGLIKLKTVEGRIVQAELPAEPDKIWRGTKDDKYAPPPVGSDMKPPIRILFGPADENLPKDDPYNSRIVAEVPIFVSFEISDPCRWLQKMGTVERTLKNLEDVAIALFNREFTVKSPAAVNRDLGTHNAALLKVFADNVVDWGIRISVAEIKPIIFSHTLNESVTKAHAATQEASATKTAADAKKYELTAHGVGEAKAKKALLLAEADGLLAQLTKQAEGTEVIRLVMEKKNGMDALQLQTLVDALKGGHNTFLAGGSLIQSLVDAFKTAMNQKGGSHD
ncbi:MAG: hypothetical protein A2566_01635 [Candidatus Zambryskibacteria bacterium RIFOXYD1_FULL_40_13]|nr:MAG: hypothetical protein A2566_01635 [Candidatus Zambryskibacteria bacterium RIFOXYD1_FULL_40_13]